ncbi:MAG: hypothetical protein WCG80_16940 [Spirochaetales bacterium]
MIYIQKKQFEDWWDNQWIRFDSDIETINSRKSCAKDGFEFGLSTVWNEVERLKKELEEARQPEVVGSSEVVSRDVERWYAFVNANALSMLGSHELAEKLYALIDGNHALQLPAPVASPVPTLDELKTGLIAELKKYGHGSIEGIDALRELVYHPEITGIIVRHFHALLTKGRGGV